MNSELKLYLVHAGFYDASLCGGIYEGHANYFVVAESFEAARVKAKLLPEFIERKMHVDGIQEINAVAGYEIRLENNSNLNGLTHVVSSRHPELSAPR